MIEKINISEVKPKESSCGLLKELYSSENLSISHIVVLKEGEKHMHEKMEEVYYVEKGEGEVVIGNKTLYIKKGDTIPIPKNTWHYLKKTGKESLEVLVITHPRYDPEDLIFENSKRKNY